VHKKTQLLSINSFLQLIVLYCFCLPLTAHADTNSGVTWLTQQSQELGNYSSPTDIATPIQATTETWRALVELGESPATQPSMSDALAFIKAEPFPSTEYLARQAIVRIAANESVDTIMTELTERLQYNGGLGDLPDYGRTVIDTAFALEAIALANFANTSIEKLYHSIDFVLQAPIFNKNGQIDADDPLAMYVTAVTMRSLWHYRHHVRQFPALDIDTFLEKAQNYLMQELAAANHETFENALALIAIIPQLPNLDSVSNYLSTLEASQLPNGSWDNDVYTTALVLRTLNTSIQPIINPDLGGIIGTVLDNETNTPLASITITLSGEQSATQVTNELGQFKFTGLDAGEYSVQVSDESGIKITSDISLTAGETLDLSELRLLQTTNITIIQGNVINTATQQPIENISITVIGTNLNKTLLTNEQGAYLLTDVPAGDITLEINQEGYSPISASVTVKEGGNAVIPLELSPTSTTITGIVTDAHTGEPLTQATILVNETVVTQTNEAGQYRVEGVSGELLLSIKQDGYDPVETTVTIETNTNLNFSPELYVEGSNPLTSDNTSIRGTVVDEITNNVLSDVSVTCKGDTLITNVLGQFTCTSLPEGKVVFELSLIGYQSRTISTEVGNFTLVDIGTIPLTPENPNTITGIEGLIMDNTTRQFLIGTTVNAQFGDTVYSATSATDGSVIIEIPGSYTGNVTLTVEGYKPIELDVSLAEKDLLDLGFVLLHPLGTVALLPDLTGDPFDPNTLTTNLDTLEIEGGLAFTIRNKGAESTTLPITVRIFNDINLNYEYDSDIDVTLGHTVISEPLLAGTNTTINIPVKGELPFRDAPIFVVLDHEKNMVEVNENNNVILPISQCRQDTSYTIDLALCIDTSPSVLNDQLTLQLNGVAKAIEDRSVLPRNNSVRLSIIQFAGDPRVEVPPTFLNENNAQEIADKVRGIKRFIAGTEIEKCINTAVSEITSATPATDYQIINVSTDGDSNKKLVQEASLAAKNVGINALNAVAIGQNVNMELLDTMVFPQPSGGERGYVTGFSDYEEYAATVARYIGTDVGIGTTDLTASRFYTSKNPADKKASLHLRVGKKGMVTWPLPFDVDFWEGKPDEGGRFLGSISVSAPVGVTAHYQDIRLDGVTGLSTGKTLYAIIDSDEDIMECNRDNNIISTQVKDAAGTIAISTDATKYEAHTPVNISYTVANKGILPLSETLPSGFAATFIIEDAKGDTVVTLPVIDIATLNVGSEIAAQISWDTAKWLTGIYRIKAQLHNEAGQLVDETSVPFEITYGDEATVKFNTYLDKPAYNNDGLVQVNATIHNQSLNRLIEGALVQVTITNPEQKVIYSKVRALNILPPGGTQELLFPHMLSRAKLGEYTVKADVINQDNTILSTETSTFEVSSIADYTLLGEVYTRRDSSFVQVCSGRVNNVGHTERTNLPVRHLLLDIDNQTIAAEKSVNVTIRAGSYYREGFWYYTQLLSKGDYACIVQAEVEGQWKTLDFKTFSVTHYLASQCDTMYAVHDEGVSHSQLFTYDLDKGDVKPLGTLHAHSDIEGMDINPETQQLYATTGTANSRLYLVDGHTGELTFVGLTGFNDVVGLTFDYRGDLWGWSSQGLIKINHHTGKGELVFESKLPIESLADKKYTNDFYATSYSFQDKSSTLWIYSKFDNEMIEKCSNIPGEIESLELLSDGKLIYGTHNDDTLGLYVYDPYACKVVEKSKINTPYNDVEAIAWPVSCTYQQRDLKNYFTQLSDSGDAFLGEDRQVRVRVYGQYHAGILAAEVEEGAPPEDGKIQLISIADENQDGMNDFLIIYPDGKRQVFYYFGIPQ